MKKTLFDIAHWWRYNFISSCDWNEINNTTTTIVIQRMTTKIQPLDPQKQENQHTSKTGNVRCACWESKGSSRPCSQRCMILSITSTSFCLYAVYYVSKYAPSLKVYSIPNCLVPVHWVSWVGQGPTEIAWRDGTTNCNLSYKHVIFLANWWCNKCIIKHKVKYNSYHSGYSSLGLIRGSSPCLKMLTPTACVQSFTGSLQTSGPFRTSFTIPLPFPFITTRDKNNI